MLTKEHFFKTEKGFGLYIENGPPVQPFISFLKECGLVDNDPSEYKGMKVLLEIHTDGDSGNTNNRMEKLLVAFVFWSMGLVQGAESWDEDRED